MQLAYLPLEREIGIVWRTTTLRDLLTREKVSRYAVAEWRKANRMTIAKSIRGWERVRFGRGNNTVFLQRSFE